jgi:hypothetical protein
MGGECNDESKFPVSLFWVQLTREMTNIARFVLCGMVW